MNKEKIKVSVIVPVYNVEKHIEKCIKTLINQKFKNYEIIIVNDGSPDNSQEIIDIYYKMYPNLIVPIKKKNGGLSSARNLGIEKSKGEYIMFVDSDDYVTDDYISALYNEAIKTKSDIVVGDFYIKSGNKETVFNGVDLNMSDDLLKNALISMPAVWNKIYKKDVFTANNIRFPQGLYYEDLATTPKLFIQTKKISYLKKPVYYYVEHSSSIMNQSKYSKKMDDIFSVFEILYNDNNIKSMYMDELEFLYIKFLLHDASYRYIFFKEGKESLKRIFLEMKNKFPNWSKNKYYIKMDFKYKIICNLLYLKQYWIVKLISGER